MKNLKKYTLILAALPFILFTHSVQGMSWLEDQFNRNRNNSSRLAS